MVDIKYMWSYLRPSQGRYFLLAGRRRICDVASRNRPCAETCRNCFKACMACHFAPWIRWLGGLRRAILSVSHGFMTFDIVLLHGSSASWPVAVSPADPRAVLSAGWRTRQAAGQPCAVGGDQVSRQGPWDVWPWKRQPAPLRRGEENMRGP